MYKMDKHYENLLLAFEEAEKARDEGTFPIGAIIVDADGSVVSRGRNRVFQAVILQLTPKWTL